MTNTNDTPTEENIAELREHIRTLWAAIHKFGDGDEQEFKHPKHVFRALAVGAHPTQAMDYSIPGPWLGGELEIEFLGFWKPLYEWRNRFGLDAFISVAFNDQGIPDDYSYYTAEEYQENPITELPENPYTIDEMIVALRSSSSKDAAVWRRLKRLSKL